MKPSVGRIVHYTSFGTPGGEYSSVCRAAVITVVHEDLTATAPVTLADVGLAVMNPTGMFFHEHVVEQDKPVPGTWHWPERVE